ncbi:MAG: TonB-dependent receptor plug domain-containing protein, partial [Gemmatimonadetes bacterium]|nr:TonB-dependent receptor plug domain-containing protein [Gemmatimonadota bacterium]
MISLKLLSGLSVLLLVSPLAGKAHAQERPDSTAPVLLPGLTVGVLRTPFEALRAPLAIGVTGQDQIQRARPGLALDEALRTIPGVQVDNRYNYALGERLSIRGFGARAQFGIRGVKVIVDGIPATFPDGQTSLSHVNMSFLSRAEVVRGPASALYGSSAGGVVQLQTESPPLSPYEQEVAVTAGSDGLLKLQATGGGTSRAASYLFNLSRLEYGGYRQHGGAENLQFQGRLGYHGARDDIRLTVSAVSYDAENPGSLTEQLLAENRFQAFQRNVVQQTGEDGAQQQAGLTWRREAAGGELEVTGYGIAREVDNPIPASIIDLERRAGGV